jgi:hypothetical protein
VTPALGNLVSSRPQTAEPGISPKSQQPDDLGAPRPGEAGDYRVLNADEVQCRAAAWSPIANALVDESRTACAAGGQRGCSAPSASLRKQLLAYRAAEQRNRAASQALEAFYLLAEAEAGRDLLRQGREKIDAMLAEMERLQQTMRIAKGPMDLRQQRLEIQEREAKSKFSVVQLNARLRQLLGTEPGDTASLWPAADWTARFERVDPQAAVQEGLAQRPDLNMLRLLVRSISGETLDATRSGLGATDPMLGAASRPGARLMKGDPCAEADARRDQAGRLLAHLERSAAEEVRQAAICVEVRFQQAAIAKLKLDRAGGQIESLKLRRERPEGGVTVFDIGAAELQSLEAKAGLVHEVMAWQIARVKLKESQGLLVRECAAASRP